MTSSATRAEKVWLAVGLAGISVLVRTLISVFDGKTRGPCAKAAAAARSTDKVVAFKIGSFIKFLRSPKDAHVISAVALTRDEVTVAMSYVKDSPYKHSDFPRQAL